MIQYRNHTIVKALRAVLVVMMTLLTGDHALAQSTGVHVMGNVYGGGNLANVGGSVTVNMTSGTVDNDVYGGGALANTNVNNTTDLTVNITTVNLLGGTINGDAYGGGLGQRANNNATPAVTAVEAKVFGDVKIYLNGMDKSFYDAADDAMKDVFDTRITKTNGATFYLVNASTKGAVVKRVFGANNKNGSPQGNVTVHVFGTQHENAENIRTKLKNPNADLEKGSLTGEQYIAVLKGVLTDMITKAGILHITVTNNEGTGYQDICNNSSSADDLKKAINDINDEINAKVLDENTSTDDIDALFARIYDVEAVYGGGNEAAYIPATAWDGSTGSKTQVIIEGCDETSIEAVYGGGNAASVPETNVDIVSAHEIQTVFGGGNGKDATSYGANPGADVGVYKVGETETEYGTGNATTLLEGGYIHEAYGASNSKGNIKGNISINTDPAGTCNLKYDKLVGAGKNADVDKDVIMILGCNPRTKNPLIFGGADNANVNGNVELTITSGTFGKVFGGNNLGGIIKGHIKVNIEETECTPIRIDELYLGGNQAAYSRYGYYKDGGVYKPRTAAMAAITDPTAAGYHAAEEGNHNAPYEEPELNVISCTYIGKVFGGGYGERAVLHGNPTVNINMIAGRWANDELGAADKLGEIVDVFGGGNAAEVVGNTTVNIGTETKVYLTSVPDNAATTDVDESEKTVLGANITGDVFGGGNQADVTGNTQVNICAKEVTVEGKKVWQSVAPGTAGVTIRGTQPEGEFGRGVFGGGNKGHVYGNSYVYMGGGSVFQTVYGGGCEADVKGNTNVNMLSGYVNDGVCGGGLSGSVGNITEREDPGHSAHDGCVGGKPKTFEPNTGKCTVGITGGQVGPVEVATQGMTRAAADGGPVSEGWVWGASRGVVVDPTSDPDSDFKTYVKETDVTIGGTAFILEGVVGGGEFGHVLGNTLVKIQDECQIGVGANSTETVDGVQKPKRYSEEQWVAAEAAVRAGNAERINAIAAQMPACSHFPYGKVENGQTVYDTYDPYADQYNHPYSGGSTDNASDGKTWIGCVFGGGSGYMPYENKNKDGYNWDPVAGLVEGNSEVRISGGHILTCVYGGNEYTSVTGQSKVIMTGGTIGVPRKKDDLKTNPMIGNLFGAGKGDPRSAFNGLTNVGSAEVEISGGIIFGSVYGGSEDGHVEGDVVVRIQKNADSSKPDPIIGTWGASYIDGNVYGGGMGATSNILAGLVKGNTNITISDGTILHNVYGGGAYGSVGTFELSTNDNKATYLVPYADMPVNWTTNTGTARVTITGGTIGTNGHENGMVFGSSRGDVGAPDEIHDKLAWVYDALVTIGTAATPAQGTEGQEGYVPAVSASGPEIKGSIYGSGENGHTFNNTVVTVNGGTIGITDTSIDGGAAYLYRGNVYGGGCGTDMYDSDNDDTEDSYNPLAGIVYGNATVNINGGNVVHNVYGAGAMGSVGKTDDDGTIISGGQTTISISGGIIGVDGTTGEGNVFGAARGSLDAPENDLALVAGNTSVSITGGTMYGNVYGGGELGYVGKFTSVTNTDNGSKTYTWPENTGHCEVIVNGATATVKGHVFGAGKGSAETYECEPAMVYSTSVSIGNATVGTLENSTLKEGTGNVYGGGQLGRVENNTVVTIGTAGETEGTNKPDIKGDVFGAGAGLATHGYSALVRGNSTVTVQGKANVGGSVYGGGETASVGKFKVVNSLPKEPLSGGTCTVTVNGGAAITGDVYGACKGVTPDFDNNEGHWMNDNSNPHQFTDETEYLSFLKTLALTSNTDVTIGGSATVGGSVYGGGQRGITLGTVAVNMTGGTVTNDVYGGGALADTNTGNATDYGTATESLTSTSKYTTTVNLLGGTIVGNAYGGGLGRKEYGTSGQAGYVSPIEAMVYGDVLVELNNNNHSGSADGSKPGCAVTRVFGCNNLNGTPKGKVKVHVYATQSATTDKISAKARNKENPGTNLYDVDAVYGGGNLSPYIPVDATSNDETKLNAARTQVIIDGCDLTSIRQVYGGGNAASVPATFVEINGTYEIDEAFGGGNGADDYSLMEGDEIKYYKNCGANVGYYNYAVYPKSGDNAGAGTLQSPWVAVDDSNFDTKDERLADNQAAAALRYGSGIARLEVYGGTIHTSYGGSNSRGNVRSKLSSVYSANGGCDMKVATSYGGGKDAVSDGIVDMLADCAHGIKEMFGGSMNADVDNDINLTITNGSTLERVFGGNNTSGAINGSITVTIDESGCEPIRIDNLYLGGFLAPYSVYGYKKKQDGSYDYIDKTDEEGNAIQERIPLMKGEDGALATPSKDPCLYVISATHIGNIFGGGYKAKLVGNPHVNVNMKQGKVLLTRTGTEGEYVYKDAAGKQYTEFEEVGGKYYATLPIGEIDNVYGGGNMADIIGDTFVEIGTGTWHNANGDLETLGTDGKTYTYDESTKKWSYKDDGGTHEADVAPTPARNAAKITGNVFGGGKGIEDSFECEKAMVNSAVVNGEDKGGGNTSVTIGNGTIGGTVYGGGQIGRVEHNTTVTIGLESGTDEPVIGLRTGTDEPVIEGNVFGAGRGVHTHGYAALVRGNTTVTVQGEAKVRKSVYGGGEIASVGKYNIADAAYHAQHPEVLEGMPYSLVSDNRGVCNVIVKGNAVIGPEGSMEMKATGSPDDIGHVFGAGKGVLPYHDIDGLIITGDPWRMKPGDDEHPTGITEIFNEETFSEAYYTELYGADYNKNLYNYLADYLRFIETLALTTKTEVTVDGNAFVKGSVYGGSENGHVQHDTHVTISGTSQIGHSKGISTRFTEDQWLNEDAAIKPCASWDFVATESAPYDPLATSTGTYDYSDYPFVPAADRTSRPKSDGGKPIATDGHTFYGNVFGGGSGLIPYAPGKWHREAGSVGGNTKVDIIGGHIMTSVYGGNEQTDVGTYLLDPNNDYQPTIPKSGGKCTINMTGGTVGVPRTKEQIEAHPVICNVFGAGKGDQRIFFNTWTNVIETEVNISGTARIYGSTFGGGEDGHVIGNAKTNIGRTVTIGTQSYPHSNVIIGSVGTSYMDGNVFGGGRGFSGEAQTAGTVGGNVEVNIENGKIYGSVYGGGRLASVGTMFDFPTLSNGDANPAYGQFKEDETGENAKTYGHVTINISGGTIGRDFSSLETLPAGAEHSGNVFGGSMGRLELLNGDTNPIWPKMAQVKESNVNIYGTAEVRRSVYGGGELGTVRDNAYVTIGGQKTADADANGDVEVTSSNSDSPTIRRDVYGGGYGSKDMNYTIFTIPELKSPTVDPNDPDSYESHTYAFTPMQFAGCVGKSTYVNVVGGYIRKSVYGGGELASVGVINYRAAELASGTSTDGKVYFHDAVSDKDYYYETMVKHDDATKEFALSWPYEFNYVDGYPGTTHVNITGGRLGLKEGDTDKGFDDNGDVYGAGKGMAGDYRDYVFCANVGSTDVVIDHAGSNTLEKYSATADLIAGAVYGGGEEGHVMGNSKVTMKKGFVYHSVYGAGSGKGKFETRQLKIGKTPGSENNDDYYTRKIYSITAGKVFGNSTVEMSGGIVVRNVYGGGNMGSVGKGNYAGGTDDYSYYEGSDKTYNGYGEALNGSLWTATDGFDPKATITEDNKPTTMADHFLSSGMCTVKITGGTIGYIDTTDPSNTMYPWNSSASLPYGNVFGGCRGESAPNITETPRYLYSPEFFVGYANETSVEIGKDDGTGPAILGSVYGGGMDGHVRRDAHVIIKGGEIGLPFTDETEDKWRTTFGKKEGTTLSEELNNIQWLARGNVYGAGSGIGKYKYDFDYDGAYTTTNFDYHGNSIKEEDFSTSAGSVTRFTKVEILGGNIHRNVYGGGSLASIGAPKIPSTREDDPLRRDDSEAGKATRGKQSMNEVTITGGTIGDAIGFAEGYGGFVFGASRGDDQLSNPALFATSTWTTVNIKPHASDPDKSPVIYADVYGGGEVGSVRQSTEVKLTGGTIKHDVYGGGKGTEAVAANVGGETLVKLNEGVGENERGCVVSRLFGGNNVNGTPGGKTKVYVYATQNIDLNNIKTKNAKHDGIEAEDATTTTYDVKAVYGGGNLSPYIPAGADDQTEVYIEGCGLTSIKQVYGGGNSASTPATMVTVNSAYEIQDLFGGGDGQDSESGANVGYYAYPTSYDPPAYSKEERKAQYGYGSGVASLNIYGGRIHRVFGGSNTKGNVRETAITMLDNNDPCLLDIDEVYGGGKSAPMDAEAILYMACIPGLKVAYGGAQEADVLNNVVLNITNGTYDRVFGGNNISGTIKGSITVNIEETGCKPLIIGELYGGGNLAGYSVYGYKQMKESEAENAKLVWMPRESDTDNTADGEVDAPATPYDDPQINVKSFTSIGIIYGGGLGETAVMVGNPTVNIDEVKGKYADYVGDPAKYNDNNYEYDATGFKGKVKILDGNDVPIPSHAKGAIGAIQNVFGGGNAAEVKGNTNVNIGTLEEVTFETDYETKEENETDGEGNIVYEEDGVTPKKKTVIVYEADGKTPKKKTVPVVGVDIRGNVYGGGNNAGVTGNTNVVIGKAKTTTTSTTQEPETTQEP